MRHTFPLLHTNLSYVSDGPPPASPHNSAFHQWTSIERPPLPFCLLYHTHAHRHTHPLGKGKTFSWFFGRGESPELVKRSMKIWVMSSLVGAALLFFLASRTTSDSDLHVNRQVHEMANTAADDILPEIGEPGSVRLEDYQQADPSPSSKWSVKPGPIQHGAPLMPYLPIPSPAPPAFPPEHHD